MHASSSGSVGTGSLAPGNASVLITPLPRLLQRLDSLVLPGTRQELAPGDLSRYRVAAITAGTLLVMDLLLLLSLPETLDPGIRHALGTIAGLSTCRPRCWPSGCAPHASTAWPVPWS
jgi:hypothetical protein